MLSRKWNTLNHNCQKFNAIYKQCGRLTKSGENEVDLMKRARSIYPDENRNNTFNHEDAWATLRKHSKWDAPYPAPIDLTEGENVLAVNTEELFGPDDVAEKAFEVAKEKDRAVMRLEELRFLSLSTKDLFLLRKTTPLALPREEDPAIKLGCESECRYQMHGSQGAVHPIIPYYPVDNRVVTVRTLTFFPDVPCSASYSFWLGHGLAELREPCTLQSCGSRTPCGRAPVMLLVERLLLVYLWVLSYVGPGPNVYCVVRACGPVDTIRHHVPPV
ncbi:hypothetical protein Tco_0658670 [Tanacetum coccineum]